jgi:hypothetical protein
MHDEIENYGADKEDNTKNQDRGKHANAVVKVGGSCDLLFFCSRV